MWVLFLHENSTRFVCRNFKFSRILKYYLFCRLDFGFAEIRTQDKLLFLRTTFWCNLTRDYSIDTLYKLSITILTVKFASYHLLSLLHCWSSLINNNLRFLIVKETADVIADAIFRKRLKLHNSLCSFNISLVEFDPLWWWVLMDSNHRPLRYQHSALTNWAKDPFFAQSIRLLHSVVEDDGIEPTTPCLQSRCSPSWANPPLNSALPCRSFACIVYYASLFASRTACSFNLLRFSCSSARKSAFDQSNIPISVSTCSFYCWYVIRR